VLVPFLYSVVPILSTPYKGVLNIAYNTTVGKYAPVKNPMGFLTLAFAVRNYTGRYLDAAGGCGLNVKPLFKKEQNGFRWHSVVFKKSG
jgi:hypothetical protein